MIIVATNLGFRFRKRWQVSMTKQDFESRSAGFVASHANQFDNLRNVILHHFERYSNEGKLCDEELLAVLNGKAGAMIVSREVVSTQQYADMLYSLALLNYESASYDQSARLVDGALKIREEAGGPRSDLLLDFELLVLSYNNRGRFTEAESAAHSWLRLAEDEFGVDHPYIGKVTFCLAQIYRKQGRKVEAEQMFLRSLATYAKTNTLESADASVTRTAYGDFLRVTGRSEEAKQIELTD
jgi:tetratricopeptide (TPR) repeat protein